MIKIECSQPILGNRGGTCNELGRDCPFIRIKINNNDEIIHYKCYVTDMSYARIIYNKIWNKKIDPKYAVVNALRYIKQLEAAGTAKMTKQLNKAAEMWPQNKEKHNLSLPPYGTPRPA